MDQKHSTFSKRLLYTRHFAGNIFFPEATMLVPGLVSAEPRWDSLWTCFGDLTGMGTQPPAPPTITHNSGTTAMVEGPPPPCAGTESHQVVPQVEWSDQQPHGLHVKEPSWIILTYVRYKDGCE